MSFDPCLEIKMYSASLLALLAQLVGMTHSFSWDIVVGDKHKLAFYYREASVHYEVIPSASEIKSVTYDPLHYRVLFADYHKKKHKVYISSFNLSNRKIQPIATIKPSKYGPRVRIVYDPVTQLLFWKEYESIIYSFSLKPESSNDAIDGNPIVKLDHYCQDIAVESCGGYIYWITNDLIERARFDGSQREILINSKVLHRGSLVIDPQTRKLYWTELIQMEISPAAVEKKFQLTIKSADYNGRNVKILQRFERKHVLRFSLAVSKDFIYWKNYDQVGIWLLPKNASPDEEPKAFSISGTFCWYCRIIAANYTIKEVSQNCEARQSLISNEIPNDRPDSTISVCHNYCLQGDCNVNADGQPTCRCKSGYSGVRCEIDVNRRENPCFQYCLNNGVCSINKQNKPVCKCKEFYEGVRCNVHSFLVQYIQAVSLLRRMLKDVTAVTLGPGVNSTWDSTIDRTKRVSDDPENLWKKI